MIYLVNFIIFISVSILYFYTPFQTLEMNEIFLTISTFLFSIFAGFFISRQGNRYSIIREQIATMNGAISNIYRHFQYFGEKAQNNAGSIIKKDYNSIISNHDWDYHFAEKSTTITNLHELVIKTSLKNNSDVQKQAIERIMASLADLQIVRKMMLVLRKERIPTSQWVLLSILASILLITVSTIPSMGMLMGSILKGVFTGSILFVFVLINKLNRLDLFEKTIGEESIQDVLDILNKKK